MSKLFNFNQKKLNFLFFLNKIIILIILKYIKSLFNEINLLKIVKKFPVMIFYLIKFGLNSFRNFPWRKSLIYLSSILTKFNIVYFENSYLKTINYSYRIISNKI
jgi:hypothetical protein